MRQSNSGISFIIPIYNTKSEYIKKSVESITNQSEYQNYEVLLINDNSADITKKYCEKICLEHDKVKLYNLKKNSGVSFARNYGISNSKYEWIMFVDADDWIEKDAYNLLFSEIRKKSDIDMYIFNTNIVMKDKVVVNKFLNTDNIDFSQIALQIINKSSSTYCPKYNCIGVSWAKLYRKKFLINNNVKFNEGITRAEDHLFILNVISFNPIIKYVDQCVYNYRRNQFSTVNKYNSNLTNEFLKTLNEMKRIIEEKYNFDVYWDAYYIRCLSYLSSIISNKILNKNNNNSFFKKLEEIKKLYKIDLFKKATDKVDIKNLSNKYKILILLKKCPIILALLYKVSSTKKNKNME